MITVSQGGSFNNTLSFLGRMTKGDIYRSLEQFGQEGVRALSSATPKDEGETANSWSYQILRKNGIVRISWHNDHMAGHTPVAILLQYGHATRSGAYVEGRDFINPAIQPIFDKIADAVWKEVTK